MAITQKQTQEQSENAGLCVTCLHSRKIISARDSAFFLCQLGFTDPNFPKYPRLPVLTCSGYRNPADITPAE
jgi:hypothetical protein